MNAKPLILLLLGAATVSNAQVVPRPTPPQAPTADVPKVWLYFPPNEPGKPGTWSPYSQPLGVPLKGVVPGFAVQNEAEAKLIRAQTDTIKALSKRIDELEARIAGLEGKSGASK